VIMVKTTLAFILAIAITGHSTVVFAAADDDVRVMVGQSAIVNTDWPIARVSLTSADIADAMVTLPNQLLIQGKLPGTISMFVWERGGAMRRFSVTVERDLSQLARQIRELFPGENITVEGNGKSIVMAGTVTNKFVADKAVEVAAGYVDKKEDVVTLLQIQAAGPPPQVLLRVRFAEVSRSALTELGSSFFTSPLGVENTLGRVTTQQFSAPGFDKLEWTKEGSSFGDKVTSSKGEFTFSDFLNIFLFNKTYDLGIMIRALQSRGLFQSLAEPNLVAETGKEASFLAGGEFPIPVAQGGAAGLAISVMFKEFGVRLNFTPTVVAPDRIRLKVRPEVSTLDFANAIVLQGFRIPALSTRRTETELELMNGQTFAIAGLLNHTATETLQKVPGIGDIPILGLLFRSKAAQKNRTELVVMITPEIVQRNSPGVTNELPRLQEPYLAPLQPNKAAPYVPPAFTTPGWGQPEAGVPQRPTPPPPSGAEARRGDAAPQDRGNGGEQAVSAPEVNAKPNPADAAAVLKNQWPKAPTMIPPAEPAAAPAAAVAPAVVAPPATPVKPLTKQEQKRLEKAREAERKAEAKRVQERQEQDKRQQQLAREQAKRDAEAAAKAAREAARQAEIDKKRQKSVDEAARRLKEAEAAYQLELAKKTKS
jgi:pilus assembly protein CpaC